MSGSANVTSLDAICRFAAAVIQFQADARISLTAMDSQLRQVHNWLERNRPGFWKSEIENCSHEVAECRIRLHQCRMRKLGDFRPTCYEEQKALERAQQAYEFAQSQLPTVKHWIIQTQHESNEFRGRAGQLLQILDREIPRLIALLRHSVDRLEAYAAVQTPDSTPASERFSQIAEQLLQMVTEAAGQAADKDLPIGDSSIVKTPDRISAAPVPHDQRMLDQGHHDEGHIT